MTDEELAKIADQIVGGGASPQPSAPAAKADAPPDPAAAYAAAYGPKAAPPASPSPAPTPPAPQAPPQAQARAPAGQPAGLSLFGYQPPSQQTPFALAPGQFAPPAAPGRPAPPSPAPGTMHPGFGPQIKQTPVQAQAAQARGRQVMKGTENAVNLATAYAQPFFPFGAAAGAFQRGSLYPAMAASIPWAGGSLQNQVDNSPAMAFMHSAAQGQKPLGSLPTYLAQYLQDLPHPDRMQKLYEQYSPNISGGANPTYVQQHDIGAAHDYAQLINENPYAAGAFDLASNLYGPSLGGQGLRLLGAVASKTGAASHLAGAAQAAGRAAAPVYQKFGEPLLEAKAHPFKKAAREAGGDPVRAETARRRWEAASKSAYETHRPDVEQVFFNLHPTEQNDVIHAYQTLAHQHHLEDLPADRQAFARAYHATTGRPDEAQGREALRAQLGDKAYKIARQDADSVEVAAQPLTQDPRILQRGKALQLLMARLDDEIRVANPDATMRVGWFPSKDIQRNALQESQPLEYMGAPTWEQAFEHDKPFSTLRQELQNGYSYKTSPQERLIGALGTRQKILANHRLQQDLREQGLAKRIKYEYQDPASGEELRFNSRDDVERYRERQADAITKQEGASAAGIGTYDDLVRQWPVNQRTGSPISPSHSRLREKAGFVRGLLKGADAAGRGARQVERAEGWQTTNVHRIVDKAQEGMQARIRTLQNMIAHRSHLSPEQINTAQEELVKLRAQEKAASAQSASAPGTPPQGGPPPAAGPGGPGSGPPPRPGPKGPMPLPPTNGRGASEIPRPGGMSPLERVAAFEDKDADFYRSEVPRRRPNPLERLAALDENDADFYRSEIPRQESPRTVPAATAPKEEVPAPASPSEPKVESGKRDRGVSPYRYYTELAEQAEREGKFDDADFYRSQIPRRSTAPAASAAPQEHAGFTGPIPDRIAYLKSIGIKDARLAGKLARLSRPQFLEHVKAVEAETARVPAAAPKKEAPAPAPPSEPKPDRYYTELAERAEREGKSEDAEFYRRVSYLKAEGLNEETAAQWASTLTPPQVAAKLRKRDAGPATSGYRARPPGDGDFEAEEPERVPGINDFLDRIPQEQQSFGSDAVPNEEFIRAFPPRSNMARRPQDKPYSRMLDDMLAVSRETPQERALRQAQESGAPREELVRLGREFLAARRAEKATAAAEPAARVPATALPSEEEMAKLPRAEQQRIIAEVKAAREAAPAPAAAEEIAAPPKSKAHQQLETIRAERANVQADVAADEQLVTDLLNAQRIARRAPRRNADALQDMRVRESMARDRLAAAQETLARHDRSISGLEPHVAELDRRNATLLPDAGFLPHIPREVHGLNGNQAERAVPLDIQAPTPRTDGPNEYRQLSGKVLRWAYKKFARWKEGEAVPLKAVYNAMGRATAEGRVTRGMDFSKFIEHLGAREGLGVDDLPDQRIVVDFGNDPSGKYKDATLQIVPKEADGAAAPSGAAAPQENPPAPAVRAQTKTPGARAPRVSAPVQAQEPVAARAQVPRREARTPAERPAAAPATTVPQPAAKSSPVKAQAPPAVLQKRSQASAVRQRLRTNLTLKTPEAKNLVDELQAQVVPAQIRQNTALGERLHRMAAESGRGARGVVKRMDAQKERLLDQAVDAVVGNEKQRGIMEPAEEISKKKRLDTYLKSPEGQRRRKQLLLGENSPIAMDKFEIRFRQENPSFTPSRFSTAGATKGPILGRGEYAVQSDISKYLSQMKPARSSDQPLFKMAGQLRDLVRNLIVTGIVYHGYFNIGGRYRYSGGDPLEFHAGVAQALWAPRFREWEAQHADSIADVADRGGFADMASQGPTWGGFKDRPGPDTGMEDLEMRPSDFASAQWNQLNAPGKVSKALGKAVRWNQQMVFGRMEKWALTDTYERILDQNLGRGMDLDVAKNDAVIRARKVYSDYPGVNLDEGNGIGFDRLMNKLTLFYPWHRSEVTFYPQHALGATKAVTRNYSAAYDERRGTPSQSSNPFELFHYGADEQPDFAVDPAISGRFAGTLASPLGGALGGQTAADATSGLGNWALGTLSPEYRLGLQLGSTAEVGSQNLPDYERLWDPETPLGQVPQELAHGLGSAASNLLRPMQAYGAQGKPFEQPGANPLLNALIHGAVGTASYAGLNARRMPNDRDIRTQGQVRLLRTRFHQQLNMARKTGDPQDSEAAERTFESMRKATDALRNGQDFEMP